MKHTPGPWTVTKDGETTIREANGRRRMIAKAYDTYGDRDPERPNFRTLTDELMPNARLIAAAPDLLYACQILLRFVEIRERQAGAGIPSEALKATEAIRKALGIEGAE